MDLPLPVSFVVAQLEPHTSQGRPKSASAAGFLQSIQTKSFSGIGPTARRCSACVISTWSIRSLNYPGVMKMLVCPSLISMER